MTFPVRLVAHVWRAWMDRDRRREFEGILPWHLIFFLISQST